MRGFSQGKQLHRKKVVAAQDFNKSLRSKGFRGRGRKIKKIGWVCNREGAVLIGFPNKNLRTNE